MTDDDGWQAISYARLLKQIAPYAIVTNGNETKVYDVLAPTLTPIESPETSIWQQNKQQTPSISEDLRYEAGRRLIGLNPTTLKTFCQQQVSQALVDLKGTVEEAKYYIPDLYLPRMEAVDSFSRWMESESPCFAIISESGWGKTNFMCATAEIQAEGAFVLFYPARRLRAGLLDAIRNDFIWEFRREREPAFIIERFNGIAQSHGTQFFIFVDGLDEYPGDRAIFKNELIDLASRLHDLSIRLCVSCKAFDWEEFVIDDGRIYNLLANSVFPVRSEVHDPQPEDEPTALAVGFWLSPFSETELDTVFEKYKIAFSLKGELRDATRSESKIPLMLRLIAEVFSELDYELPRQLSISEIFDKYWARKLGKIPKLFRNSANMILCKLAQLCVESDRREIDLSFLSEGISWSEDAFQYLQRLNLIRTVEDTHRLQRISFEFEKIRSYAYTVQTKKWTTREPKEVAQMITELFSSNLGLEAIEFYFISIDLGTTPILTELAKQNLIGFVQLLNSLRLGYSSIEHLPIKNRREAFWKRVEQFAISYSDILKQYFSPIKQRVEPYSTREAGVLICPEIEMYQLRVRTDQLPQPVVTILPDLAAQLFHREAPPKAYIELRPSGKTYLGGFRNFTEKIPQVWAWETIEEQVADLLANRFLDESSSPGILQERTWQTLLHEPSGVWFRGEEHQLKRYWERLGFENPEQIQSIELEELIQKVNELIMVFYDKFPHNVPIGDLKDHERGSFNKFRELLRLEHWLELLEPLLTNLTLPKIKRSQWFEYWRQRDLSLTLKPVEALLPDILTAYRSLVERNFPAFVDHLALFRLLDSHILAEIYKPPSGDYLSLRYIPLPHFTNPTSNCTVRLGIEKKIPIKISRLRGYYEKTVSSHGFGRTDIAIEIAGERIKESDVPFYVTRFSTRTPILDQAYQLLGLELECLLSSHRGLHWYYIVPGRLDYETLLDTWIRDQNEKRQQGIID